MMVEPRLDMIGAALAHSSRSRILCELMDGRAFTNKELACAANITAQTASAHLKQLEITGLTCSFRSGRNIYHRIINEDIANVLEALACLSPADHLLIAKKRGLPDVNVMRARSCYNHIAGQLGILITDRMIALDILYLQDGMARIGPKCLAFCNKLAIDMSHYHNKKKPIVKLCLDWTERKHHISGPLATEIMNTFLENSWLERTSQSRALHITESGYNVLEQNFNITRKQIDINSQK